MKTKLIISAIFFSTFLFSQTPSYEFITEPIDILTNFYDYMPGGYNNIPVQIEDNGSVYIVFHAKETNQATRRVYYAHIDANGNLIDCDLIGSYDLHEGFPAIDLDPVIGDPFVAWHSNVYPSSADMEISLTYDMFHLSNVGNWREPFVIIDENTPSANAPNDEFIWPEVHIGPSPISNKRRVYVIGKNNAEQGMGHYSENVLIAFSDYDQFDLEQQSQLSWTSRTIPLLDNWHEGIIEFVRPYLSVSVSNDGHVALIGYTDRYSNPDSLIVLLNDNFGEGDFEYFSFPSYEIDSPWQQYQNIIFQPQYCNHQNSIFHDNNSKISWVGNMALMENYYTWFSDSSFVYPKVYTFDIQTQELSFYDLYIGGTNPADNIPMLPWDLNEDGLIDSTYANGEPKLVEGWPIYFFDHNMAFHENYFHLTKNEEKGWLAAVWSDGLKARKGNVPIPGYIQWCEVPEIAIAISADNGATWSQPIFLNSLETPELEDMIPEYIYPGDKIEDLGNSHGKLHLMFLDDELYGSQGMYNWEGGSISYCALDIDFGPFTDSPEITVQTAQIKLTNYPNPFNPSTTISFDFSSEQNEPYELSIYNLKGQKVKNLSTSLCHPEFIEGQGENRINVVWNGIDDSGKLVSSGVYFAKLKAGNQIATCKMLLMK